jgi:O-antigen/teichoic acid export membrane protein
MLVAYAGRLASQGLYFILLVRSLLADGFGAFASTLALVSILAPFAGWGSANVLVMHVSRDRGRFPALLGNALATIAASGSLLMLLAMAIYPFVGARGASFQLLLLLAFAELFAGRIVELAGAAFQAHDNLRATAAVVLGDSALRLGAVLLFTTVSASHSAEKWAQWYAGAAIAAGVVCLSAVIKQLGRPQFRGMRSFRSGLREGGAFSLGIASKSAYSDIDKVMLAKLASASAAGVYAAAYRVLTMAMAPVQALVFSSNTRLFRQGLRGAHAVLEFAKHTAPVLAIYGLGAGIVLYFAGGLMPVILGPSFAESAQVIRWLALMPFVQGVHFLFGDALMGTGRQGIRSAMQLGTAVLNVVLNLVMIPSFGWRGAALASLASELLLAVVLVIVLFKFATADERRWRAGVTTASVGA